MKNNILLVAINAKYIHSNLAVYCLKEYAKEYENDIEIMEFTINQYTEFILQKIYKKRPKVVAFSCYIWNISYVTNVIRELKKILKDVEIWVGGPEVSYRAKDFFEEYAEVNGVIIGEGERSFKELCGYWIENKIKLDSIMGIVYKNEKDELFSNPTEKLLDLSLVPFPYSNLDKFKNKIIYYESSRGCPFSCSYCLSSIDKKLRFRDLSLVKKEIQYFLDNKIPQVKFVDRTFNCKKEHAMEIWKYIYENDNKITNFHFEVSADLIDDEELELFKKMRPGLIQLEIGVQTTNPNTLKEINRKTNMDRLREVVYRINSFKNIHQHLDLIVGLPYEDKISFIKSFDDVYKMRPEQLQLGFLKVLSGALMDKKKEDYGLVYTDNPPYEVMYTNWISYNDILELKLIENMVEVYYNSRQFVNTINYLEKKFKSPYKMFESIGNYYEANNLNEVKHSRIKIYEHLFKYVSNNFEDVEVFLELIKLDLYLRENIKSRPDFINLENKEILREYYREFKTKLKTIHIETFNIDVFKWINEGVIKQKKQIVLFDYNEINPINHCCKIVEIMDKE